MGGFRLILYNDYYNVARTIRHLTDTLAFKEHWPHDVELAERLFLFFYD